MLSLPNTAHEHHGQIVPHVDRLAVLDQLIPHMERAEATLYPVLERLMQNRHSMTPMRREHEQMRRLIEDLGRMRERLATGHVGRAEEMGLRRILYRLFSMIKVHLAEEELYLGVLDHNLSAEEQDALARDMEHAIAEPI
jgi:hemerythrin-like domain-containing protein